jgi:hypothetical protein
MSHTPVVATTPILSASPGPATTNTYMRFREAFSVKGTSTGWSPRHRPDSNEVSSVPYRFDWAGSSTTSGS